MSTVQMIPLEHVFPNPDQPRKAFDPVALSELAGSIAEHGLIQPITVTPRSGMSLEGLDPTILPLVDADLAGYMIVAGERRWRAAQMLRKEGLMENIPCLVQQMTRQQVFDVSMVENLGREDMLPMEEARGFARGRDEMGYTTREMARKYGKSEGFVRDRMALLNLTPELQNMVDGGHLPITVAGAVSRLSAGNQMQVVKVMNEQGLNAMEASYLADQYYQAEAQGSMFDLAEYFQERAADLAAQYLAKLDAGKEKVAKIKEALSTAVRQLGMTDLAEHVEQCREQLEALMRPSPALALASDEDEDEGIVPCGEIVSPRCDGCPWAKELLDVGVVCFYMLDHPKADPVAEAAGCPHPLPTLTERMESEREKQRTVTAYPKGADQKRHFITDRLLVRTTRIPNNPAQLAGLGVDVSNEPEAFLRMTIEVGEGNVLFAANICAMKGDGVDFDLDLDFGGPEKKLWENAIGTLQAGHVIYQLGPRGLGAREKLFRDEPTIEVLEEESDEE